ncbi:MAG: hypothetical protein Q8N94_07755 [Methanoregula sp.]|nr:hypothetical protein [Methanoregula sp.]
MDNSAKILSTGSDVGLPPPRSAVTRYPTLALTYVAMRAASNVGR